ncbi:hypothetical protein M407DRAFT_79633 [Tulasnella calospora MUT 4182]|uniref:Ribosomal RNA-processing protein 43 n=1 Tax=Tulasnella calospora MUT 4182 TaxID=1051891 RepID=A0A0C3KKS5_9AGAM|nr:hypothetical protein M407DRAFT_79633 [Tulasnella calospora MUT 4182]
MSTDAPISAPISLPPASASSKLDAKTFQRLHPRAYLERFLSEGIRPDGREPNTWRDVSLNTGSISTAEGSALVRLGTTTIVCGIKAEVAEPELGRPEHGFIVPNVDLSSICSPKFKPGPPGEEAQILSERINAILIQADVVPTPSLCIHPAKACWVLYIDITCINYDGNAFDACLLAAIAALRATHLPKPTFDEETERVTCSRTEKLPLQVKCIPLSSTFGVFDSKHLLYDPTAFEEPLLETSITVITDEKQQILSSSQLGLGPRGDSTVLERCTSAAIERRLALEKVLNEI